MYGCFDLESRFDGGADFMEELLAFELQFMMLCNLTHLVSCVFVAKLERGLPNLRQLSSHAEWSPTENSTD